MATQNSMQQRKATQALQSNNDKLLKRANRATDWEAIMNDPKDRARVICYAVILSLGGFIGFALMIALWFKVYNYSSSQLAAGFFFLIAIGCFVVIASRPKVFGKDRPALRLLGYLFVLSTLVGFLIGFSMYFNSLSYYYKYGQLRSYTNVAASQNPLGFRDGGMMLWTEDTRLDTMRSVGYKSKQDGQIYCVAPIIDGSMSLTASISYYAIGENCCGARGEFECDDATIPTVRASLVLLQPKDVVSSWMTWAGPASDYPKYEAAVALQQATYSVASNSNVKLVRWVVDPLKVRATLYDQPARTVSWIAAVYYFLLLAVTGYLAVIYIVRPRRLQDQMKLQGGPNYGIAKSIS